jgi:hypothetical protein
METPQENWKTQLTSTLLTVPDTFWTSFFNKISFQDIVALLAEDSGFRDSLLVILQDDLIYQKQIEKNIILECIEDLEQDLDLKFRTALTDFFVQKGFQRNDKKVKNLVKEYLDTLIDIFRQNKYGDFRQSYIDSEIAKLEKLKLENIIPFELMDSYKNKSFEKFYEINQISKKYKEKIQDEIQDDVHLLNFINHLFYGKNSYQNVKEYLEAIKNQIDKKYHSILLNCIQNRIELIKEMLKDKNQK